MYNIKVRTHFDAAHFLPNYTGQCSKTHGHRWIAEFEFSSSELKNGMVIDFKVIKNDLNYICPDHSYLNDIITNPTAELIAQYLYNRMKALLLHFDQYKNIDLISITVWETPECGVTYSEPEGELNGI